MATANACIIVSACGGQRAHRIFILGLGVDGQAVTRCHLDARVRLQMAPIFQNQVDVSVDRDARGESNLSIDNVPACSPVGDCVVSVNQGTRFGGC